MISSAVSIDLGGKASRDRHKLEVLDQVGPNTRVIVDIGHRQHISPDAARLLHGYGTKLHITIIGARPEAVAAFVEAARAGAAGVFG